MIKKLIPLLVIFASLLTSCPTAPPLEPTDQLEPYLVPNAPSEVVATNGYDDSITLTWTAVENATSYQVWGIRSTDYGATSGNSSGNTNYSTLEERGFKLLDVVQGTSYTLDETHGISYVFSVVAMRNIGTSASDSSKSMLYSRPSVYVEGSIAGDIIISGMANSSSVVLYWAIEGIESVLDGSTLYQTEFSIDYRKSGENEWKTSDLPGYDGSFSYRMMASSYDLTPNTSYDFRLNMNVIDGERTVATRQSEVFPLFTDENLVPEPISSISASTDRIDAIEVAFTAPRIPEGSNLLSVFRIQRGENASSFQTIAEVKAEELTTNESGAYIYMDNTAEENTEYYYRVINGFTTEENPDVSIWQANESSSAFSDPGHRIWIPENLTITVTKEMSNTEGIPMRKDLHFTFSYSKVLEEGITFTLETREWNEDDNKTSSVMSEVDPTGEKDGIYSFDKIESIDESNTCYRTFSYNLVLHKDGKEVKRIGFQSDVVIDLGRSESIAFIKDGSFKASTNRIEAVLLSWELEDISTSGEEYKVYIDEVEYTGELDVHAYGTLRSVEIPSDGKHEYRLSMVATQGDVRNELIYPFPAYGDILRAPDSLDASDGTSKEGIEITFEAMSDDEVFHQIRYKAEGQDWNYIADDAVEEGKAFLKAKGDATDGERIEFQIRSGNKDQQDRYTDWSESEYGSVFGPGAMKLAASDEEDAISINLSWHPADGAVRYYIYRDGERRPGNVSADTINEDGMLTYSDESVSTLSTDEALSKTYTYEVFPVMEDGTESEYGSADEGKLFSPPNNVTVSKGEFSGYVHLTWEESNTINEATHYQVKRYELDEEGNEINVRTFTRTMNDFFDDASSDGKAYYTVRALKVENNETKLESVYQNSFEDKVNFFGETEEGNLGYMLSEMGAPAVRTVMDDEGYLAPYVEVSWERVDGATSYSVLANINNIDATTNIDDEAVIIDVVKDMAYNPESMEIVARGTPRTAGYLEYDPSLRRYTYLDQSGTMRTTTAISSYSMNAFNEGEISNSATARSTVYRQPRPDEIISMTNEILHVMLHNADNAFGGDWFYYDISNTPTMYYYPSEEDPIVSIEKPGENWIATDRTGTSTFNNYNNGIMTVTGTIHTGTTGVAADDNPLNNLQNGSFSASFDNIETSTGDTGKYKTATITYPEKLSVNSVNTSLIYTVNIDSETHTVNDSTLISRPF